jgi:hypothetical protein
VRVVGRAGVGGGEGGEGEDGGDEGEEPGRAWGHGWALWGVRCAAGLARTVEDKCGRS